MRESKRGALAIDEQPSAIGRNRRRQSTTSRRYEQFLPARQYGFMSFCHVRHKPVSYRNGWTDRVLFGI